MKNKDFCHLHLHTEYSLLDGIGSPIDYIKRAKELGFESIAMTDHGNIDGAVKWQKAASEVGVKPVFGCEFYLVENIELKEKGEKRYHINLFAKNKNGFSIIMKMLNIANLTGFYYRPRIDFNILYSFLSKDIIISTACLQSFVNMNNGIDHLKKISFILEDDLYFEIMPHNFGPQIKFNKKSIELANELKSKVIMTNDCHYIKEEDAINQEVLLAVQRKAKWKDKDRFKFDVKGLYLKTANEMINSFVEENFLEKSFLLECAKNTRDLESKCELHLDKLEVNLPLVKDADNLGEEIFFKKLVDFGFLNCKDKFVCEEKIYKERVDKEISVIKKLGFLRYFLIVWELINWCKKNNVYVGPGRGSVSGSLVAYLLGITKVDPIKYGLFFERFISEDRNDLPDIDIDIEDIKRDSVREHLNSLYGEDCVAGISTFLQMKSRMVLKDVGRVFDIHHKDIEVVTKLIDDSLKDIIKNTEEGKQFYQEHKKIVDISLALEGQIRSAGSHAAGVIISNVPFSNGEKGHLVKRSNKFICNWDKKDAEYMGLLKLDALGLSALSILHYAFDLIKRNHDIMLDFDSFDFSDKKVFKEFAEGKSIGVFQFGTYGLRKLCEELRIDNFNLLMTATALYRPAPLHSGLTKEFVDRRNSFSEWDYVHRKFRPIVKDTMGIICYQEQIMLCINKVSGLSLLESDKIRKALDKDDPALLEPYKDKFIDSCVQNNKKMSVEKAEEIWDYIKSYGGYSFNKAHACAYTMISYYDMWTKIYFPAEFLCASLTYGSDEKKEEFIEEALDRGLNVIFPKIGKSKGKIWETDGKNLYMPLINIKGIGEKTIEKIEQRKEIKGKIYNLLNEMRAFDKFKFPRSAEDKLGFKISYNTVKRIKINFLRNNKK